MSLLLIAVALAMDAFAVSIVSGSQYRKTSVIKAMQIALFFALFQALMPLIGYLLGHEISSYIKTYEPYIVFFILVFLGFDMIKNAKSNKESDLNISTLLLLAVATSIDALAVGFTFSFENVNIWFNVLVIGIVTFVFSLFGVYIGKSLGRYFEEKAEYFGGIILILLGIESLVSELNLF